MASHETDLPKALEHKAVIDIATVDAWFTDPDGIYIDGTFGRGGHSRLLLERLSSKGQLLVVDRDPEAIVVAEQLAKEFKQVYYNGSSNLIFPNKFEHIL